MLGGAFLLNGLAFELKSKRAGVYQIRGVCICFGVFERNMLGWSCEDVARERGHCKVGASVWAFND